MSEHLNGSEAPRLPELAEIKAFIGDDRISIKETTERFNLAVDKSTTLDVVHLIGVSLIDRYLISPSDAESEEVEEQLKSSRIPVIEPYTKFSIPGYRVYELPFQAKPLSEEKFYPYKESTDIYISDQETFQIFGKMWKSVYEATGRLPDNSPMGNTIVKEFGSKSGKLIPVPPYHWNRYPLQEVQSHFFATLTDEIKDFDKTIDDDELGMLLGAARMGWES